MQHRFLIVLLVLQAVLPSWGQEAELKNINSLIRELVRGKNGIAASKIATQQICSAKPDSCVLLKLLVAKELALLGTPEASEAAIFNLEALRDSMDRKDPELDTVINNLGSVYEERGMYREAQSAYEDSVKLSIERHGARSTLTGASINNLAGLLYRLGNYPEAQSKMIDVLDIFQSGYGPQHQNTAIAMNNVGMVYQVQGRLEIAEPFHVEALAIRKAKLGYKDPATAESTNNLAGFYSARDLPAKAEPLYLSALAIRIATLGLKHPLVTETINNLAETYRKLERYDWCAALYEVALANSRSQLGDNHPTTAVVLSNLGVLYTATAQYQRSEDYLNRALATRMRIYGIRHPDVAVSHSNLASLHLAKRDMAKAEYHYLKALSIYSATLGVSHASTGNCLNNLGVLYLVWNDRDKANSSFLEAFTNLDSRIETQVMAMDEVGRRDTVAAVIAQRDAHLTSSFAYRSDARVVALALKTTFLYKGLRLQASRESKRYLESEAGSGIALKQELFATRQRTIRLERAKLSRMPAAERELARQAVEERVRMLETESSALRAVILRDGASRKIQGRVELQGLQQSLRLNEAFLEVDYFQKFSPGSKGPEKRFGDYQYGAIVFRKSGEPVLVSLGSAGKIHEFLSGLRDMSRVEGKDSIWDRSNGKLALRKAKDIADHRLRYQAKVKELWKLVLEPVEAKLGAAEFAAVKSWVICPDGPLHGLAWETLIDGQGRYLRQRAQVRYVESPRTFIYRNEERTTGKPLYVHTPDYGNGKAPSASAAPGMWSAGLAPMQRGVELGKAIQGLHADVEILTGTAASEEKLRKLENRREVVIYTHGEYVEGPMSTNEEMGRVRIALAGAAKGMGKREEIDGTLTASDVAGWRLRGAELVALVGCETGVGSGDVGEGLQGMRRALYLAGSKWQLLSLWTVVDAAAEIWMEQFYEKRKLNPKLGIPEVVDLVQKDFLSGNVKPKRADGTDLGMDHPLLWAGMTLNGQ